MDLSIEGTTSAVHAPPAAVRCPSCAEEFSCDACLHVHLVSTYNVRYVDVFGAHSDAWLDFCEAHEGMSPSALGL